MSLTMPRNRIATRNIIVTAFVACLVVCCAVPAFIRTTGRSVPFPNAKPSKVSLAWRAHMGDVRFISFASGGQYFCAITKGGGLSVYSASGRKCYEVKAPGVDRVVLSPDASRAMGYSYLDSANPNLTFFDSKGKVMWKMAVSGAVWSADACRTDDGCRFAAGTGDSRVYVMDIGRWRRSYRWWRAPGAVVSLNLDRGGEEAVLGTWQESMIVRCAISGRKLWETGVDTASRSYVQLLDATDRAFVRCEPNRRASDGLFAVLDAHGSSIWQGKISAAEKTRVLPSPNGQYVCLGQVSTIKHKGKSMCEKHAVLLGPSGERLWEKGSLFFQADPLLVTSGGEVLLSDEKNSLFILRRNGDLQPLAKLPAPVRSSAASRDGSRLLLHCSDGSLCMFTVSR